MALPRCAPQGKAKAERGEAKLRAVVLSKGDAMSGRAWWCTAEARLCGAAPGKAKARHGKAKA